MAAYLQVRFCDDNKRWSVPRMVAMTGDANPHVTMRSMGVYRSRQIEIVFAAPEQLVLCGIEEEVEDL